MKNIINQAVFIFFLRNSYLILVNDKRNISFKLIIKISPAIKV